MGLLVKDTMMLTMPGLEEELQKTDSKGWNLVHRNFTNACLFFRLHSYNFKGAESFPGVLQCSFK